MLLLLGLVALGVGLDEDQPVVERERLLLPPSTPRPRGLHAGTLPAVPLLGHHVLVHDVAVGVEARSPHVVPRRADAVLGLEAALGASPTSLARSRSGPGVAN
jgi:hypothetical protein